MDTLEVDEITPDDISSLEHSFIGPTWKRTKSGGWKLPKRTLGWEIAGWCSTYLRADDGTPWKFTMEQLRFILWWYAIDENGRFVYRKGVLQRMKGWGKDPLLAVMCLVEWVGPSRFSHFDEQGEPVGKACTNAWVQVTAVNKNQTDNTMALIPSLMSDELVARYAIKDGVELLRANGGTCRLQAVTSNFRSIEGKRTTFTLLNETHHWIAGNHGPQMYETIDGNATKMDSRYLAITNAYLPGEDSVGERMREAYEKIVEGRAVDVGFLYDSVEANPLTPLTPEALRIVVPIIRGDAVWLNPETVIQSILDTTMSPSRSRRMWLNQVVADEDALHSAGTWDPLAVEGAILRAGDEIVLGFDGGKTDDATALVAIRLSDDVAFVLGCWERPEAWPSGPDAPRWEVPRDLVDGEVHRAFRTYKVRAFFADVALWESYIANWEKLYSDKLGVKASERSPIGWDMRASLQRATRAHERLMSSINDGRIHHDGDLTLRRHVLNTRRRENNYGVSFGKESRESTRKVDLYAALMLAHEAALDFRNRGKSEKPRTKRGYFL